MKSLEFLPLGSNKKVLGEDDSPSGKIRDHIVKEGANKIFNNDISHLGKPIGRTIIGV